MEVNHHQHVAQSFNIHGNRGHGQEMLDSEEENFRRLYEASEIGSIQNLKALIQEDPHILQKVLVSSWSNDQTPLHISVSHGHLEFTRFLLDQKPELIGEIENTLQRTPLHLASVKGDIEIVRLLLGKNTGPCLVSDLNGLIPLHYAIIRGQTEIIKLLINARPQSLRTKLSNGQTVLHLCVMNNHLEVLKFFIGLVFDDEEFLNIVDNNGNTALDLSLMLRQIEFIRYLLSVPTIKPSHETSTMEINTTITENNERERRQSSVLSTKKKSSCWKLLKKHLRYKGDWLQEVQGTLMLVATMIATVTFQGSINPPGGVWQLDTLIDPDLSMAILASSQSITLFAYITFLVVNTISFLASMNVILLIISGFPLKNRICSWVLKLVMCIAIVYLALSFLIGMFVVNFDPINFDYFIVWRVGSSVFIAIVLLVILGFLIRFLIWVIKFFLWVFKKIWHSFTSQTHAASSTTA